MNLFNQGFFSNFERTGDVHRPNTQPFADYIQYRLTAQNLLLTKPQDVGMVAALLYSGGSSTERELANPRAKSPRGVSRVKSCSFDNRSKLSMYRWCTLHSAEMSAIV